MTRSSQLELFEIGPTAEAGSIEPAPEALRPLAGRLPPQVRFGTSSWSFPGWSGLVYARACDKTRLARGGLGAYAAHPLLRTVGLDRSYYAALAAEAYRRYADAVPSDFRFVVKAASQCTSPVTRDARGRVVAPNPQFLDASWTADRVVGPYLDGLGDRAGVLVFQFPPLGRSITLEPDRLVDRLADFLEALPPGPNYAVELRDHELFRPSYGERLRALSVQHCFNLHPGAPPLAEQAAVIGAPAPGPLVIRWMLRRDLSYEAARERYRPFDRLAEPDPAARHAIASLIRDRLNDSQPIYVIVNNKAEGSAPLSIRALAEQLADTTATGC
ncbi:MAG: DUF72 domain-containing protein [Chromatiales bacterium]